MAKDRQTLGVRFVQVKLGREPCSSLAFRSRSPSPVIERHDDIQICDARACFPVIGGALVYKDSTHVTSVHGRTLGPYLLRALG
jgi:hypothetical protein